MVEHDIKQVEFLTEFKKLKTHDHACLIYDNNDEQLSVVAPFIKMGIERGERCIYIVDDNPLTTLVSALWREKVDVDNFLRSKALIILSKRASYLKHGYFDPDWMIDSIKDAADSAKKDGYTGLRIAGEMTWALGQDPGVDRLIEYEGKLRVFFLENDVTAICQYNSNRFDNELINHVIHVHPVVIYKDLFSHEFSLHRADKLPEPNYTKKMWSV